MNKRVAEHYNNRPEQGIKNRKLSPIFQLRKINNFIKSRLIATYSKNCKRALDIACGKGGDLQKWNVSGITELLGLDIAGISIEQARERYNTMRNPKFKARFECLDCFTPLLLNTIGPDKYDIISIQFAIHYAFDQKTKIQNFLDTVSSHLNIGKYFIVTTTNSALLVKKLDNLGTKFGNQIYSIEFESKELKEFGSKYSFTLDGAIDDCPEYLVPIKTFLTMARECGLECVEHKSFHDYFIEQAVQDFELLKRMRVFENGEINRADWDALGIYSVFVFQKK